VPTGDPPVAAGERRREASGDASLPVQIEGANFENAGEAGFREKTRPPLFVPVRGEGMTTRMTEGTAPGRVHLIQIRFTHLAAALAIAVAVGVDGASAAQDSMEAKVNALLPKLETYVESGMKAFDNPGLAIGIVSGGKLVYAKGFGAKRKGGEPVDTGTVFQIGSTTKAFLATTMAISVDNKEFAWDDRVVDLYPDFQMKDAWVTREFRMFDLLAQRSGMPPYANDYFGLFGADYDQKIHSLRYVDPVTSFRSTFAYTNITHIVAQRIVAKQAGAPDWDTVIRTEIFEPLGMKNSSVTKEAIESAANRTWGHVWTAEGTVEVPLSPFAPYYYGGAGAINSTVEDLAHWVRLQLANGEFEGKRIVSAENLAETKVARVGITANSSYAMGWLIQSTPNGNIVWHNGSTLAFGSFIGLAPDKNIGVIVLTNETNVGFPDAIGLWTLDHLMGNPEVDYVAAKLVSAKAEDTATKKLFAAPADARPAPPLAPLAGAFSNPVFGPATVTEDGSSLLIALSSIGAKLKLDPWDGDVFTVSLVPEGELAAVAAGFGPGPQGFAQFQIDASGHLNLIQVSFIQESQLFVFTRQK
jgi:CubicO group peptidase (beta-lactamase class C family)